jgi:hypothetical protein
MAGHAAWHMAGHAAWHMAGHAAWHMAGHAVFMISVAGVSYLGLSYRDHEIRTFERILARSCWGW